MERFTKNWEDTKQQNKLQTILRLGLYVICCSYSLESLGHKAMKDDLAFKHFIEMSELMTFWSLAWNPGIKLSKTERKHVVQECQFYTLTSSNTVNSPTFKMLILTQFSRYGHNSNSLKVVEIMLNTILCPSLLIMLSLIVKSKD